MFKTILDQISIKNTGKNYFPVTKAEVLLEWNSII